MAAAFGIPQLRQQLISGAHGDVLEVRACKRAASFGGPHE